MTGPSASGSLVAGPLVDPASVPGWLAMLVQRTAELVPGDLVRIPEPRPGGREAAVLVLFAEDAHSGEPDVLLQ
ncbi:MAG TPA: CoA pyrophosphatase, partial [Pseudonocardiaceae bacterium]|nr:CoA pyrophosphatase [Pseudonocardiaceae bacterium]